MTELTELLADARDLPDGTGKISELERIAAHADAAGDLRLGVAVRFDLIETYQQLDQQWRLREPVHWCLATVERAPELFDQRQLRQLRRYQRSAVVALLRTARVGLDQARSTLDDLARRVEVDGQSPAEVDRLRCRIADHLGDEPAARRWLARWRAAGRGTGRGDATGIGTDVDAGRGTNLDTGTGCPGCVLAEQAELLAGWGDWAAALDTVAPVLRGEVTCTAQPERALVALLLPYLHLGRPAEAAAAHVRAYERHRAERAGFGHLATHLRYCALGGHPHRGLDILAEQLPRLDRAHDELAAMEFAAAGALVCRLATEAGLGDRFVTRPARGQQRPTSDHGQVVPANHPEVVPTNHPEVVTVGALGTELLAVAQDLASRFDARNGTGHHCGRIAAWFTATPVAEPVALPPPPEPHAPSLDDVPVEAADDVPVTLSRTEVAAVLDRRGVDHRPDRNGGIHGRWGAATLRFELTGERDTILLVRIAADRRLSGDRLAEAYAFCNAWNHDRLLPKAYVEESGAGELVLAGDIAVDLAYGVARTQLAVLVGAALDNAGAYAAAAVALP